MNDDIFDPEFDAAEHERYSHTDAAYVLGALDSDEQRDYEAHLAGCPLCQAQTAELAGITEILAQASAAPPVEVALPDSLLPRLMDQVQRRRRRHRLYVAGALAACLLAVLSVVGIKLATTSDGPRPIALSPVANVGSEVSATVTLTKQGDGTGLRVVCAHYGEATAGPYVPGPGEQTFRLVVINRLGQRQTPTSWNSDRDIRVDTGTNWPQAAIKTIEIVDANDNPLMRVNL